MEVGALLADGSFLVINHNAAVVHIEAPQDAEIVALNEKLNKPTSPTGRRGAKKLKAQTTQDGNALKKSESGAAVGRAVTKASKNYWNASWDLVDASKEKGFDWKKLKEEDLPEEMKKLDLEGRKKFVAEKEASRAEIQKKIQSLNEARKNLWLKSGGRILKRVKKPWMWLSQKQCATRLRKKGMSFQK